jgi:hypothetical protein
MGALRKAGPEAAHATEYPFYLLSAKRFLKDEGWLNCLRIANRLLSDRANRNRVKELWIRFVKHQEYFSYVAFAGRKLSLPSAQLARSVGARQHHDPVNRLQAPSGSDVE